VETARTMGNLSRGENKRPVQREGTSKCLMLSHSCSHKCNFCSISALALGRVAGLPSQLTGRCIGTSSKVSSSRAAGSIVFSTDRHGVGASAFCTDSLSLCSFRHAALQSFARQTAGFRATWMYSPALH
jgi:hypothetical protein